METVIITGSNGTIGSLLKVELEKKGFNVIGWDRKLVPITDYQKMFDFVKNSNARILYHLGALTSLETQNTSETWETNYKWTSELAWITKELKVNFIYTSSSLVFSNNQSGPYKISSVPEENFGYGYEKRMSEEKVFQQNPSSKILRLGWQIDTNGKNTIISYLTKQGKIIHASQNWFPSCSFLKDTVDVLINSIKFKEGIYLVNSNQNLSYYEIVKNLKSYYKKDWDVYPSNEPTRNDLMLDERVKIPSLSKYFKKN